MSAATTQAEQTYTVFPVHIGNAPEGSYTWSSPLEWLSDKHPQEYDFCVDYNIDNDQVQDKHQNEMDADGFFRHESGVSCDCCGKEFIPGTRMFSMTYPDGQGSQEPMCFSCAQEAMEDEAITVHGEQIVPISARVVADQLQRPYWEVLAWIIAQKVTDADLFESLRNKPDALRRWILCNLRVGAAIW